MPPCSAQIKRGRLMRLIASMVPHGPLPTEGRIEDNTIALCSGMDRIILEAIEQCGAVIATQSRPRSLKRGHLPNKL